MLSPKFSTAGWFLFVALDSFTGAQNVKCNTVTGGCSDGNSHDTIVKAAIAKFLDNTVYGNIQSASVVFSSSNVGGSSLASVSYACADGSIPPAVAGSSIRSYLSEVVSCPNQCGSVSLPDNDNCGLGVLIVNNPTGASCFSRAINVTPTGSSATVVPSVGSFKTPKCYVDDTNQHILNDDSSSDSRITVEECVGMAYSWRYAGVKPGGNCFWGDEMTSSVQVDLAECQTPCIRNVHEACGANDRMLIYEDEDFIIPDLQDIIDIVEEYETMLDELRSDIADLDDLIEEYVEGGGPDVPLKRDLEVRFPPLLVIQTLITQIMARESLWNSFIARYNSVVRGGFRYDRIPEIIDPGQFTALVNEIQNIFNQVGGLVGHAITLGQLVIRNVVATIGLRGVVGAVAVGLFWWAFSILSNLIPHDPGQPPPPALPPVEVCELGCDGETCPNVGELVRRALGKRVHGPEPGDIIEINTDDITNAQGFASDLIRTLDWWKKIKLLIWRNGSGHGTMQSVLRGIPSSVWVQWNLNQDQNVITGAGPVYGCTTVSVVTDTGAYTAHFWEVPYFRGIPPNDALFLAAVPNFLRNGMQHEGYVGLEALTRPGQPLQPGQGAFMRVDIMHPEGFTVGQNGIARGTGQARYGGHLDVIQRTVANILGVNRNTINTHLYAHDQEIWTTPLNPDVTHREPYRQIRVVNHQERGYLMIERPRLADGLQRVRVHVENTQVFEVTWLPDP